MPDANSPVATLESGTSRGDSVITVYFVGANQTANAIPFENIDSEGWSQYEMDRVMAALTTISNYVNLTFSESSDPNADFQMVLDNDEFESPGFLGFFYQPAFAGDTSATMGAFNENGYGWSTAGLMEGGLGFSTIIHEALHGLGLDHPHDGDSILPGLNPSASGYPFGYYGDYGLNQGVYTIMSYNDGFADHPAGNSDIAGNAATPMALDIAILQEIFGANTTFNNDNTLYELPDSDDSWIAIWDTGGTDEISYDGNRDITIDLRPATLQYEEGGGGFVSAANGVAGGYTIANGVVIENATSGSGDDVINGNDADNTLNSGSGSDVVAGGAGDDDIDGGSNNDSLAGNTGSDTIESGSGTNVINGDSGRDTIVGGSGRDTINGGSGNDDISGNGGNDILNGGRGRDVIDGGANNDTIDGGWGTDEMTGGDGDDTFLFSFASDSLAGDGARDIITDFTSGSDEIDLSVIDADLLSAGSQNFSFIGTTNFTAAGQVRVQTAGSDAIVQIDRDGDGAADMEIFLTDVTSLTANDFAL